MPRGSKATRRHKINAGLEYKRGNRQEAYKLWDKAAVERKERTEAKRNKKQKAAEAAAAAAAAEAAKKAEAEASSEG